MTPFDYLLPACRKIVNGLSAKPGIHIVDKESAAAYLAQSIHGALNRGEFDRKDMITKRTVANG